MRSTKEVFEIVLRIHRDRAQREGRSLRDVLAQELMDPPPALSENRQGLLAQWDALRDETAAIERYRTMFYEFLADAGARASRGRARRGGIVRGSQKRVQGDETRANVRALEDVLKKDGVTRNLNKRIARELGLSVDHVRKVRRKRS